MPQFITKTALYKTVSEGAPADEQLNIRRTCDLLILIMVSSGVFGFIYELLFYRIDLGYFVKRGSTFGPWIPIYFFGGGIYALLVYPFKGKPLWVFLLCVISSGVLEYVTGYILYEFFQIRLWDYNTEIWNWGNINGYVCFRSVLFFGVSGLLLIYMIIPLLARVVREVRGEIMRPVCILLAVLFAADVILYQILK